MNNLSRLFVLLFRWFTRWKGKRLFQLTSMSIPSHVSSLYNNNFFSNFISCAFYDRLLLQKLTYRWFQTLIETQHICTYVIINPYDEINYKYVKSWIIRNIIHQKMTTTTTNNFMILCFEYLVHSLSNELIGYLLLKKC